MLVRARLEAISDSTVPPAAGAAVSARGRTVMVTLGGAPVSSKTTGTVANLVRTSSRVLPPVLRMSAATSPRRLQRFSSAARPSVAATATFTPRTVSMFPMVGSAVMASIAAFLIS